MHDSSSRHLAGAAHGVVAPMISFSLALLHALVWPAMAQVSWDGEGSTDAWSNGTNWVGNVAPTATGIARFDNTAFKSNRVDTSRTVRGLYVRNTTNAHAMTIPPGVTLTVPDPAAAGTLDVGYMAAAGTLDSAMSITGGGILKLGQGTRTAALHVGYSAAAAGIGRGMLTLDGVMLDTTVGPGNTLVGVDTASGTGVDRGVLDLSGVTLSNRTFRTVHLSVGQGANAQGVLRFPAAMETLTIAPGAVDLGWRLGTGAAGAAGTIDFTGGGGTSALRTINITPTANVVPYIHLFGPGAGASQLVGLPADVTWNIGAKVGTSRVRVDWFVGYNSLNNANSQAVGNLNLSDATLNVVRIGQLYLGYNSVAAGTAQATLDLSRAILQYDADLDGVAESAHHVQFDHFRPGDGANGKGTLLLPSALQKMTITPQSAGWGYNAQSIGTGAQCIVDFAASGTPSQLQLIEVLPVAGIDALFAAWGGSDLASEPFKNLPNAITLTLGASNTTGTVRVWLGNNQRNAATSQAIGSLDLSNATLKSVNISDLYVGYATQPSGTVDATLNLAHATILDGAAGTTNQLTVQNMQIGCGSSTPGVKGKLILPSSLQKLIVKPNADGKGFVVGSGNDANGVIDFTGGTGSDSQLQSITIAPTVNTGMFRLSSTGYGATGSLIMPDTVTLNLGKASFAVDVNLFWNTTANAASTVQGGIDLSHGGLNLINVRQFIVGYNSQTSGGATGTFDLSNATITSGAALTPNLLAPANLQIGWGVNANGHLLLPPTLEKIVVDGDYFVLGAGTLDFGAGSALNEIRVTGKAGTTVATRRYVSLGDYNGRGAFVNLPANVTYDYGATYPVHLYFGHRRSGTGTAEGVFAPAGGTIAWKAENLWIGYNATTASLAARGTVDLRSTAISTFTIAGTTYIGGDGSASTGGYDSRGALHLPAGSVLATGSVYVGDTYRSSRGLLELNGTTFTAAGLVQVRGGSTVEINVGGLACGLDLTSSTAGNLSLNTDNGFLAKVAVNFLERPADGAVPLYGLRKAGDHVALLNGYLASGHIEVSSTAFDPALIRVWYDGTNTCLGVPGGTLASATPGAPEVSAGDVTAIGVTEATLNGSLVAAGDSAVTNVTVFVGPVDAGNASDTWQQRAAASGPWTNGAALAVLVNTLQGDTHYYSRWLAQNDHGDGWSFYATPFYTDFDAAAAPAGLSAVPAAEPNDDRQIDLTWEDRSDTEAGFRVERSLDGFGGWLTVTTTVANVTSYSDRGLTYDTRYYYRVAAINGRGRLSAYSNEAGTSTYVYLRGVRFVNSNSTNPTPPYALWNIAATNIQDAINLAVAGDVIWVTNGVYDTGEQVWSGSVVPSRILINNKNVTLRSVNGAAVTHIVGGGTPGNHPVRGVIVQGSATLDGFTIRGGSTAAENVSGTSNTSGGGIYGGNAVIRNSVICNNTAAKWGGGAYNGAFYNCLIVSNRTTSVSAGGGGGAAFVTAVNCLVAYNRAGYWGGGLWMGWDGYSVTRCRIAYNTADVMAGGVVGGGVSDQGKVTASAIYGNKAPLGGGISNVGLLNCTVAFNEATLQGGGAYCTFASFYVNDSIVYLNTAPVHPNVDPYQFQSGAGYCLFFTDCCMDPVPDPPIQQGNRISGLRCISVDPMFIDGRYHIRLESPVVEKAAGGGFGTVDIDGDPWYTPAAMGADEPSRRPKGLMLFVR